MPNARRWLQTLFGSWRWSVLAALLLGGIAAGRHFNLELGSWGDNARFIILSESLASGQGYRMISEPGAPAHTTVPPGYPLLLAPLSFFAPRNLLVMKLLTLLFYLGSIPLFFRLAAAHLSRPAAAAATLVAGVHPTLVSYSDAIMSEIPYLFFSLLALCALERVARRPDAPRRQILAAGLLVVAALGMRAAGLTLAAAAFLGLLLGRRSRAALLVLAVGVACYYPWVLRNTWHEQRGADSYVKELLARDSYHPASGSASGPGEILALCLERARGHLEPYTRRNLSEAVCAWFTHLLGAPHNANAAARKAAGLRLTAGSLLFVPPIVLGLALFAAEGRLVLALYALFFYALILVWPWAEIRFFLPLAPLAVLGAARGAAGLRRGLLRLAPAAAAPGLARWSARAAWLGVALLAGANAWASLIMTPRQMDPNFKALQRAGIWLRENSPPEAVVACRKPYLLYLWAERLSVGYLLDERPAAVEADLRRQGADWAVSTPGNELGAGGGYLLQALVLSEEFSLLRSFAVARSARRVLVWRRGPPPADAGLAAFRARLRQSLYESDFAALDLRRTVGTDLASCRQSKPGEHGYLCYGPYRWTLPGRYRVVFRVGGGASPCRPEETAAVLDVTTDKGWVIIARRDLAAAELPAAGPAEFALDFDLAAAANLEFRVFATGAAEVRAETITLRPREEFPPNPRP